MPLEERLWKWYERHTHAIQTVLEIAQDVIPGGKIVFHAIKAVHALAHDREENEKQQHLEEVQQVIAGIKPEMSDLVEDIEQLPEFQKAVDSQAACKAIAEHLKPQLDDVLSKISPVISMSAKRINAQATPAAEKKLINQKYEILKILGSGGQGEVYQARDVDADKLVAIKMLPATFSEDPQAVAALRAEYNRVVDKLVHANIVQYRSMAQDTSSQRWFLVMDFILGKNLRKWVLEHREQPLSFSNAILFLRPIAEALDFAHQNKVVHCDLKPENIMIRESDGRLFLADFGLAKEIHTTLSARNIPSDISGTLPYMAPEQYQGRWPDHKADIWALGVILYEIVAGHHPFHGLSFEHYKDLICHEEPECPVGLTQAQWMLMQRMLRKDRGERPATCLEAFGLHATSSDARFQPQIGSHIASGSFSLPPSNKAIASDLRQAVQQIQEPAPSRFELPKPKSQVHLQESSNTGCAVFAAFLMFTTFVGFGIGIGSDYREPNVGLFFGMAIGLFFAVRTYKSVSTSHLKFLAWVVGIIVFTVALPISFIILTMLGLAVGYDVTNAGKAIGIFMVVAFIMALKIAIYFGKKLSSKN